MKGIPAQYRRPAAAVLVAVIFTTGSWWILARRRAGVDSGARSVSLLRIKKFVPGGKAVLPENMEEVSVPEMVAMPGAIRNKSDLLDARGRPRYKARIALSKGELLTAVLLADPTTFGGLAWALEPGHMAFSLRLNPEDAVAGLVQPGDFVRVFSSIDGISRVALERTRVVAVGDRTWDPSGLPASNEISKPLAMEPVLITLMGTADDALLLRRAVNQGPVGLALLSPLPGPLAGGE